MTRILLIPVAGTLAALVAISFARQPRPDEASTHELPPFDFPDAPDHGALPPAEESEPPLEMPPEEPEPEPMELDFRLEADGALVYLAPTEGLVEAPPTVRFKSIDELVEKIGDVRHTLVISNGKGVTSEALDDAEARLKDHFKVVKVYRAPETPPGEER